MEPVGSWRSFTWWSHLKPRGRRVQVFGWGMLASSDPEGQLQFSSGHALEMCARRQCHLRWCAQSAAVASGAVLLHCLPDGFKPAIAAPASTPRGCARPSMGASCSRLEHAVGNGQGRLMVCNLGHETGLAGARTTRGVVGQTGSQTRTLARGRT